MRKLRFWKQTGIQLALLVIGVFVLTPIWGILRMTFDGSLQGRATEFRFFPKQFSLSPFIKVLDRPYQSVHFSKLLENSLVVSLSAAVLAIILGASLAYAFARFRFPGRRTGLFVLLLTALMPPIAFTTPLYILLSVLGIRTTLLALILVYAAFAMPFCIWNMRAAFQAIPKETEEAAFLDGAGDLKTFLYITLPLSLPSIAVAALIAFLTAYSEFTIGWLFVSKPDTVTLAMSIYAILTSGVAQPWSQLGSLAILMSIPVVVIFLLLQRTLLERMMFGTAAD
jgi:arabinogalactan oligomer / maltooligosaccharide transport system permease protein